jgi:cyanophycin synthetase
LFDIISYGNGKQLHRPEMEILDIKALWGPNHWAGAPVIAVRARYAEESRTGIEAHARARQRLLSWLPELAKHAQGRSPLASGEGIADSQILRCFEDLLKVGARQIEMVQYLMQICQMATGVNTRSVGTRKTNLEDVFEFAVEFEVESLARACLECAVGIWSAAERAKDFNFSQAFRGLVNLADDVRLGPSTRAIVQAAAQRGIPVRRLSEGNLVMLGEGKLQRRIWTAETDATSAIAENIASDKDLTKRLLHAVGIPVPQGRVVTSGEEAWRVACEIGTPVAVKPSQSNHAQGVSLNLFSREQIVAAFDFAQKITDRSSVLVEQFIRGEAHRLLIVGGRLVAAARSQSEYLVGDGKQSIRQLIDEANRDPRRGENYTDLLTPLDLDPPTLLELEKQGLTPDSIPTANHRVLLHLVGDYTTDCTDEVHAETAEQAVLAARLIGLDVAGMDLIAENIGRPLGEQRGAILEVNAGPSLGMHIAPLHGKPRPVGEAILAQLFPAGNTGRIPVFVITGDGQRQANAQNLDRLLTATNRATGRADRSGLYVAGQRISPAHATDFQNAQAILLHPAIEVAVIEADDREAAERGLGCSRADVAIVTTRDQDGIARIDETSVQTSRILAAIHAVPIDGVALLPWNNWARTVLAPACQGKVLYYGFEEHLGGIDSKSGLFWLCGDQLVLSKKGSTTTVCLTDVMIDSSIARDLFLPSLCGFWASGLAHREL